MCNAKAAVRIVLQRAGFPLIAALFFFSLAAMIVLGAPRQAQATPQFGTQTGLPCTQCHADLNTPSKLTDFGPAFHANGDKVPEKK